MEGNKQGGDSNLGSPHTPPDTSYLYNWGNSLHVCCLYFHAETLCIATRGKHDQGWIAELTSTWRTLVALNGSDEVFLSCCAFHVQLSSGRIIALRSLVRWGSCGSQHFPFRPGLPSARRQRQLTGL